MSKIKTKPKRITQQVLEQFDRENETSYVRKIEMIVDSITDNDGYSTQFWRDVVIYGLSESVSILKNNQQYSDVDFSELDKVHSTITAEFSVPSIPKEKNMSKSKLQTLVEMEGFEDEMEMLTEASLDSVVPGICLNPNCDYTTEVEPDSTSGWCEVCEMNTVQSCLILAGMI